MKNTNNKKIIISGAFLFMVSSALILQNEKIYAEEIDFSVIESAQIINLLDYNKLFEQYPELKEEHKQQVVTFQNEVEILFLNLNRDTQALDRFKNQTASLTQKDLVNLRSEIIKTSQIFVTDSKKFNSVSNKLEIVKNLNLSFYDKNLNATNIPSILGVDLKTYKFISKTDYSPTENTYHTALAKEYIELYSKEIEFNKIIKTVNFQDFADIKNKVNALEIDNLNDLFLLNQVLKLLLENEGFQKEFKKHFSSLESLKNSYTGNPDSYWIYETLVLNGVLNSSVEKIKEANEITNFTYVFLTENIGEGEVLTFIQKYSNTNTKNSIPSFLYEEILRDSMHLESIQDYIGPKKTNLKSILSSESRYTNTEGIALSVKTTDLKQIDDFTLFEANFINASKVELKTINSISEIKIVFKNRATITIPAEDIGSGNVVFKINPFTGSKTAVPHVFKNGVIEIYTKDPNGVYVIEKEEPSKFTDLGNNFAKDSIIFLEKRKLVAGTSPTEYSIGMPINRASFAVMLSRALELENTKSTNFKDIKGKWFEDGVQALYEEGYIAGITSDKFGATDNLTRQDAAVIITRIFNDFGIVPKTVKDISTFEDYDQMSGYAKPSIQTIYSLGIMGGKPGNLFDPKGSLTRAEMAKILHFSLKELGLY